MRHPLAAPGAMFVLSCLLCCALGCTKVSTNTSVPGGRHSWTQPGVLRVAVPQDVKSLNPLLSSSTVDGFVDRLLFEPLLSADPSGHPVPILASVVPTQANAGISADGLTITYRLRPGIRWSDGVAVSSADVRWTWTAILNSANNVVSRHGYDVIRDIQTPDATTVVVHLKHRFAPFVNTFFAESDQPYEILPAHVLRGLSDLNHADLNTAPTVSDGPFQFREWVHGDHITVDANPNFFFGAPKLQRIVIQVVPDENTSVRLLSSHAIDYIFQASINTFHDLRNAPGVRIAWNNMNGYQSLEFNLRSPILRDPRVRTAIASAIDKRQLVQDLTAGQELQATEDIPSWMWAYDPAVQPPPFDERRARSLLGAAGYAPGPGGLLYRNGAALRLLMVSDIGDATRRKLVVLVQSMLRRVGIDGTIKLYPADLLYAPAGMGGILHNGKFDVIFFGWYSGLDPDDASQFTCANFPPQGYNDSHYCNAEMEQAQRTALSDYGLQSRRAAYARIQMLLARDNPEVFFWWQRQQEPVSVDFKGFSPNPVVESWNAWQWSI